MAVRSIIKLSTTDVVTISSTASGSPDTVYDANSTSIAIKATSTNTGWVKVGIEGAMDYVLNGKDGISLDINCALNAVTAYSENGTETLEIIVLEGE